MLFFQRLPDVGPMTSVLDDSSTTSLANVTVKEESPSKIKKTAVETLTIPQLPVTPSTPQRKRKAAIEQSNLLKKLKQKV